MKTKSGSSRLLELQYTWYYPIYSRLGAENNNGFKTMNIINFNEVLA